METYRVTFRPVNPDNGGPTTVGSECATVVQASDQQAAIRLVEAQYNGRIQSARAERVR